MLGKRWRQRASPRSISDTPKQLLAKTSRYYRRILYGSAAALTVAILAAALLFGNSSVNQYRERQMPVFVEEAQTQVDQLSARLTQFAELHESVWAPRQTDAVPAYLYADKLAADGGVTVTKDDLTATPFMLVSSLTGIENRGQLAMYLRVVRAISSAPTIDARKEGITLDGFIYSTDGKFLAASPAESSNDMDAIRRQSIAAFIHAKTAFVEQLLSSMTPAEARRQRPLWRPAAERFDGKSVSHLIVPMYQGEDRVMTIALSLPDRQFMQYFLRACSATRRQRLHEAETAPPLPDELDALLREAFRTEWHKERLLIEAALRDRDAEALRRRSHRLQGALMALGFDDLVGALRDLQQMLPQTDWLVTVANYERLLADVDACAD